MTEDFLTVFKKSSVQCELTLQGEELGIVSGTYGPSEGL